jgi:glycosyltransferase involved in cell wall biosynthesis
MRLCLIGDFSKELDEGYKNVSHHLADELEQQIILSRLNIKNSRSGSFWKQLFNESPDVFHIITQPTYSSLVFAALLKVFWKKTRILISALRPETYFGTNAGWLKKKVISLLQPDLFLVQSSVYLNLLTQLGCKTRRVNNGVDINRFHPVNLEDKRRLRQKYGLDAKSTIVLHVGHLEKARNLDQLIPLVSPSIQIVVAGSVYMGTNHDLILTLENAGLRIFKGYQAQIEEFFMLADIYVFLANPGDSLSMPLSILEAFSCNLPVITTRFKGIDNTFKDENGLVYIDSQDELSSAIEKIKSNPEKANTRKMVENMSWNAISLQLQEIYMELLDDKR